MTFARSFWREVRDERWASGIRLWVDLWRDYRAWRLNKKRTDPAGKHLRWVRNMTAFREANKQWGQSHSELVRLQQAGMAQANAAYQQHMLQQAAQPYGNLGSLLNNSYSGQIGGFDRNNSMLAGIL